MALIFFGIFLITAKHLQSIQGKGKEEKETAGPSSLDYWKSLEFLTSLSNRPTRKTTDLTKHVCNLTHMQWKIHTHNQYFHVEWLLKNYYLAFFSGAFFSEFKFHSTDWQLMFYFQVFLIHSARRKWFKMSRLRSVWRQCQFNGRRHECQDWNSHSLGIGYCGPCGCISQKSQHPWLLCRRKVQSCKCYKQHVSQTL